jgi:hypothetical protein
MLPGRRGLQSSSRNSKSSNFATGMWES